VRSDNLLLIGEMDPSHLAVALASLVSLPADAVDVSSADSDDRNWNAAVICTYERASGDVTWLLELYLTEAVTPQPTASEAAAQLAEQLGIGVLYPAVETLPSAYWLVAPGGLRTRARVYEIEKDDRVVYKIDAVEKPVPLLPSVPIALQPEVIREYPINTPLTDELNTWLSMQNGAIADEEALWLARTRLGAWEILTVRMTSHWPPDGWYPAEFYRTDLETRDELAAAVERLPVVVAERFKTALERLDENFQSATVEGDGARLADLSHLEQAHPAHQRGWWWQRLPDPPPWPE
jgi:hypothetical protein